MKVILLEDVVGAGHAGDVVEVANGYARNKLLPSGIAIEANKTNMKTLEHRRAKIAAKKTADKEMAQILADKLDGKQIGFTAKAGESGKLFGSITAADIVTSVKENLGFELDRRKFILDSPLKEIGLHDVRYRIYPGVEAIVKVRISADGELVAEEAPPEEEGPRDTYADEVLDADEGETMYTVAPKAAEEPADEDEPAEEDRRGDILSPADEEEPVGDAVLGVPQEAEEPAVDETPEADDEPPADEND